MTVDLGGGFNCVLDWNVPTPTVASGTNTSNTLTAQASYTPTLCENHYYLTFSAFQDLGLLRFSFTNTLPDPVNISGFTLNWKSYFTGMTLVSVAAKSTSPYFPDAIPVWSGNKTIPPTSGTQGGTGWQASPSMEGYTTRNFWFDFDGTSGNLNTLYGAIPADFNGTSVKLDNGCAITFDSTVTPIFPDTPTYTVSPTFTNTPTPSTTWTPTLTRTPSTTATRTKTITSSPTPTSTPTTVMPLADTIGAYQHGTFRLRMSNSAGSPDIIVAAGDTTSYPVTGDWDGDGYDTVGLYYQQVGVFALYDDNNQNPTLTRAFVFGNPGDIPISGQWVSALQADPIGQLGRHHDGVGVFRPSNGLIYLISAWPQPPKYNVYADYTIVLGNPGWLGLAGRWKPGALDTAAVYEPDYAHFYMTNASCDGTTPGPSVFCLQFSDNDTYFGAIKKAPLKGDWLLSGQDGIGIFDAATGTFYLKNTFPDGSKTFSQPDFQVIYGYPGDIPLAGHWKPAAAVPPQSAPPLKVSSTPSATRPPAATPGEGSFD